MPKPKKRKPAPIGSRTTKPTAHQMSWYRKQERKIREARALARAIVWYFGYNPIQSMFDSDIALRDMGLALLGRPMVAGAEVPTKTWKKIFPKPLALGITYYLNGRKIST